LIRLPKSEDHKWKEFLFAGEWTEENSGGGDILGLGWRKNPQYILTLTKTSDVSVVLKQEENTSIGFYIVKQIDAGKKMVDYGQEVGKTDSFKMLCSTGVNLAKLPEGNYIIIASTYDSSGRGKYILHVYSDDQNATLAPIANEWKFKKELKGEWNDQTAGGSPNNPTFTDNPQFKLSISPNDQPVDILIQLVQESSHFEETGIGFLMFKRTDDGNSKLGPEQVKSEDIRAKPEGWVQKIDVVCRTTIGPDETRIYTIIPSTFKPNINRSFQIYAFSDHDISLDLIQ